MALLHAQGGEVGGWEVSLSIILAIIKYHV